jgi:hypothetical protein
MWQQTVIVLLCVFCVSSGQISCQFEVTNTTTQSLESSWCDWTPSHWALVSGAQVGDVDPSGLWAAKLDNDVDVGVLTSPLIGSTQGQGYLMRINYRASSSAYSLSFYAKNAASGERTRLWTDRWVELPWEEEYIEVATDFDFHLEIVATRAPWAAVLNNDCVYIAFVEWIDYYSFAPVPWPPATSTTAGAQPSTSLTTRQPTTCPTATSSTLQAPSSQNSSQTDDSSVVLITAVIGSVLAVIVVAVVIAAIIYVCKRNKHQNVVATSRH